MDKADKYILIFISSCGLISILPFITLHHYEFAYPFMWTMQYLSIPFSIISILTGYIFYTRLWIPKLKRINKKFNQYLGIILFSTIPFFGLVFTSSNGAVLFNSFIGEQNEIELNTPVLRAYTDKNGSLTYHHVVFQHPFQERLVDIYVKKQYEVRDNFNQKMFLGSLNMFYSK